MNVPLFSSADAARANQDDSPLVPDGSVPVSPLVNPPKRKPLGRQFPVGVPSLPGAPKPVSDEGTRKTSGREIFVALLMLSPALLALAILKLPARAR